MARRCRTAAASSAGPTRLQSSSPPSLATASGRRSNGVAVAASSPEPRYAHAALAAFRSSRWIARTGAIGLAVGGGRKVNRAKSDERRKINDSRQQLFGRRDSGRLIAFVCECGDPECHRTVPLSGSDYAAHRPGLILADGQAPAGEAKQMSTGARAHRGAAGRDLRLRR